MKMEEIRNILIKHAKWSDEHGHDVLFDILFTKVAKEIASQNQTELRESLKGFFTWINEYENLEYTEKGIEFYVNEYLNKK